MLAANSGSHNRIGGLSVSLASPDGRVIGGGVGGVLIAATPVQVTSRRSLVLTNSLIQITKYLIFVSFISFLRRVNIGWCLVLKVLF